MGRRMQVEADDIFHLLGESRVGGALEGVQAMRLQAVGAPDALHRVQRQADSFGHRAAGPAGHPAGRVAAGQCQHLVDGLDRDRLFARRSGSPRGPPARGRASAPHRAGCGTTGAAQSGETTNRPSPTARN